MVCDGDYSITLSNEPANIVLGKGEKLIGEKCYRLLRQSGSPCVDCPLQDTINSGTIIPLVKFDNRFNEYFEERCFPILSSEDTIKSFILYVKNITKSRELEEKSSQMKKLSALGQISSGVAHDFNNVLTVVLGRVQLMKKLSSDPHMLKSPDMISKKVLELITDSNLAKEKAKKGIHHIQQEFSNKNVAGQRVEFYHHLVG